MVPLFINSYLQPRPPTGRNLVLCFDGTSSAGKDVSVIVGSQHSLTNFPSFRKKHTNVVRMFELLQKDNNQRQFCYYQPGIGANVPLQEQATSKSSKPSKLSMIKDATLAKYVSLSSLSRRKLIVVGVKRNTEAHFGSIQVPNGSLSVGGSNLHVRIQPRFVPSHVLKTWLWFVT